jgi:hypothetical protein
VLALQNDLTSGMPLARVAERHVSDFFPDAAELAASLTLLQRARMGPFAEAKPGGRSSTSSNDVFQPIPDAVTSGVGVEQQRILDRDVLMVHAPGAVRFRLVGGAYRLRAGFGIRPEAYLQGATDGVEFSVMLRANGREAPLFRRYLDPLRVQADRGVQNLALELETSDGTELVLRTDPGPARNADWDWSFWTGVRLERLGTSSGSGARR